jgi:hypothetical protein
MDVSHAPVRKSAFGRTNLFLTTNGALLRELRASASTLSRLATAHVYHSHANNCTSAPAGMLCWHCCHAIDRPDPFRLPRVFDTAEGMFHVYGWFCSPPCCKAYLIGNTPFDRGYQMSMFTRMLREVYNIVEPVIEAPPRIALKQFGGPFDIETFRAQQNVCGLIEPPFVSYCMLVEERRPLEAFGETSAHQQPLARDSVRGLRRPASPIALMGGVKENGGAYAAFLSAQPQQAPDGSVSVSKPAEQTAKKARLEPAKASKVNNVRGLARFSVSGECTVK